MSYFWLLLSGLSTACFLIIAFHNQDIDFRMINDIDIAEGWEGPIWVKKSDHARLPNFEYIPSNDSFHSILQSLKSREG